MTIAIARTLEDVQAQHGCVLVPTMGALHRGHRALIERAASIADAGQPVVVSVFVNPTQFNEQSDFDSYPRNPKRDHRFCAEAGATCIFEPALETVYPADGSVRPPPLPEAARLPGLEDAFRPGHFSGVCQVCRRLFELTRPVSAVFGEKDWQQLVVIRALVSMLELNIEIVAHETIREDDGLAMSSRNELLGPNHRRRAIALARAMVEAGRHDDPKEAEHLGRRILLASRIRPDYFCVRDAETLLQPSPDRPARVLVAARVGVPRLIDNAPWPGTRIPGC